MSSGRRRCCAVTLGAALACWRSRRLGRQRTRRQGRSAPSFPGRRCRGRGGRLRRGDRRVHRAYELSPNFAVLYNIATAEQALGDEPAALTTFERYLAEGGQGIPAARRAEVAAEIKQLAARTGVVVPRVTPDGARLTLDGSGDRAQRGWPRRPGESRRTQARGDERGLHPGRTDGHRRQRRQRRRDADAGAAPRAAANPPLHPRRLFRPRRRRPPRTAHSHSSSSSPRRPRPLRAPRAARSACSATPWAASGSPRS